ncbi:MAG: carboxypeptidase-like regulatory domain-containing protein [Fuerstiella sp.]|nr:carboxypeptidase-like regulatory domain-containing protein [Fuerstiella sp.]
MRTFAGNSLAAVAIMGIAIPVHAFAETNTGKIAASVTDVALSANGELHGQVVQSSGRAVTNAVVRVSHKGSVIAEVKTDRAGRYAVKGLRSGLHVVKTSKGQQVCRFWAKHTAPSAAKKSLVMSADSHVIRGQMMAGGMGSLMGATAIAGTAAASIWTGGQETFNLAPGTPPASP